LTFQVHPMALYLHSPHTLMAWYLVKHSASVAALLCPVCSCQRDSLMGSQVQAWFNAFSHCQTNWQNLLTVSVFPSITRSTWGRRPSVNHAFLFRAQFSFCRVMLFL
jgi:hypothetical protein